MNKTENIIYKEEVMNKVNKCIEELQKRNNFKVTIIYDKNELHYSSVLVPKMNFFATNIDYHIVLFCSDTIITGNIYNNKDMFINHIDSYQSLHEEVIKLFKYELMKCDRLLYEKDNKPIYFKDFIAKMIVSWVRSILRNKLVDVYTVEEVHKIGTGYTGVMNLSDSGYSNEWDNYRRNWYIDILEREIIDTLEDKYKDKNDPLYNEANNTENLYKESYEKIENRYK